MDLREAVIKRRSIRWFLSKPVPTDLIEKIIADSLWAPSWGNTQTWKIFVLTGNSLEQFKQENRDMLLAGKKSKTDIPMPTSWPDEYKSRYRDIGRRVLDAVSIERQDMEGRNRYYGQMFSFFNAPALLLFTVDKKIALEYAMLDVGLILQTICLLAQGQGLGTCILAASVNYPEISRKICSIPDSQRIIMGVALGWPDSSNPVNQFERKRGNLEEFVQWVK